MMDYFDTAVESFEGGGFRVRIEQDVDHGEVNPLKDCDQLTTFVIEHRDYDFGGISLSDLTGYDPSDYRGYKHGAGDIIERHVASLHKPVCFEWLSLLDHSGLHMYRGGGSHWSDPGGWDSGTVGLAVLTYEDFIKEYGEDTPENRERAQRHFDAEIETLCLYVNGEVYGYVIEDEEGEHVDSCWGFYGLEYAEQQAREALKYSLKDKERRDKYKRAKRLAAALSEARAAIEALTQEEQAELERRAEGRFSLPRLSKEAHQLKEESDYITGYTSKEAIWESGKRTPIEKSEEV